MVKKTKAVKSVQQKVAKDLNRKQLLGFKNKTINDKEKKNKKEKKYRLNYRDNSFYSE